MMAMLGVDDTSFQAKSFLKLAIVLWGLAAAQPQMKWVNSYDYFITKTAP